MVHYRNMDAHRVEAFWDAPTLEQLISIIRENLNDTPLVNSNASLQSKDEEPENFFRTDREYRLEGAKEVFKTYEKVNSLSNAFHDAIIDESKSALVIDKLQVALKNLEGNRDPYIRRAFDIARKFIDAKKCDYRSIVDTSLELTDITRELLLTSPTSSPEDYGDIAAKVFEIELSLPLSVEDRLILLNEMIDDRKGSYAAYAARAKTCMRSGDYVQALNDFAEVVVRTKFEHWYLIEECVCHFQLGQYSAARDILERWIVRQQNGYVSLLNFEFLERLPAAK